MGLNGKAVLPMVLGLGCDTMATLTTRVRYTFGTRAYLHLELGAGAVTRSVVGLVNNDSPLVRIQGGWGAAGLAGGVVFR